MVFSSRARYDHFDTPPCRKYSVFMRKLNSHILSYPHINVKLESVKKDRKLEQKFQKSIDKNRAEGVE